MGAGGLTLRTTLYTMKLCLLKLRNIEYYKNSVPQGYKKTKAFRALPVYHVFEDKSNGQAKS